MIPILLCPSAPAISWKAGLGVASRSKRIFKDRLGFSVSGFAIVSVGEADETLRSPAARPGTGKGGSVIVDHDSRHPGDRLGEIGNRYGDKLDGWFLDGGHRYYDTRFDSSALIGPSTAPFRKLALAARKGNDGRVLCFNSWILPRLTEYQDYFAGEGQIAHKGLDQGVFPRGLQKGLMAFGCFTLENRWGHIDQNRPIARPKHDATGLIQKIRHARANRYPIAINLEMYEDGSVGPDSSAVMWEIGGTLKRKDNPEK